MESILIKIYNFHSSALKTNKIKKCFEFAQTEFKELLRHVSTRWLSLMPTIDRLVYSWPVKYYFLTSKGADNCHRVLWEFISEDCDNTDFSNEEECTKESINECYLFFLQNLLPEFSKVILYWIVDSILKSDRTILDIDQIMRNFCNQLKCLLANNFFGNKVRCILKNLIKDKKRKFTSQTHTFLQRTIKYLEDRYDFDWDTIYKNSSYCLLNQRNWNWHGTSCLNFLLYWKLRA